MLTPTILTDASTFRIRVATLERRLKFLGHVLDQDLHVTFELANVGFPVTCLDILQPGRKGRKRASEIQDGGELGVGQVRRVPRTLGDICFDPLSPLPVQRRDPSWVVEATPGFRVGNVAVWPAVKSKWVSF